MQNHQPTNKDRPNPEEACRTETKDHGAKCRGKRESTRARQRGEQPPVRAVEKEGKEREKERPIGKGKLFLEKENASEGCVQRREGKSITREQERNIYREERERERVRR